MISDNLISKAVLKMLQYRTLTLPHPDESRFRIDLISYDRHIYMPIFKYFQNYLRGSSHYLSAATKCVDTHDSCVVYKIIIEVWKHVCGHSWPTNMEIWRQRNGLHTNIAPKCCHKVTSEFPSCRCTKNPKLSGNVSPSTLFRMFNDVLCIDYMFLGEKCVFHDMDSHMPYSAGLLVENAFSDVPCEAFDICWLSTFWPPNAVSVDHAPHRLCDVTPTSLLIKASIISVTILHALYAILLRFQHVISSFLYLQALFWCPWSLQGRIKYLIFRKLFGCLKTDITV